MNLNKGCAYKNFSNAGRTYHKKFILLVLNNIDSSGSSIDSKLVYK